MGEVTSMLRALKHCHGQRKRREQMVFMWPREVEAHGGKPQGDRIL